MVQFPEPNQVLHEGRLFEIGPLSLAGISAREAEGQRRAVVELRRIGDDVVEVLVQPSIVGFDSHLPLVAPVIAVTMPLK